jgi:hypothetical protein
MAAMDGPVCLTVSVKAESAQPDCSFNRFLEEASDDVSISKFNGLKVADLNRDD